MLFVLLSILPQAPSIKVPPDRFVAVCAGLSMKTRRKARSVRCEKAGDAVEITITEGGIEDLTIRAKSWPKTLRFVLKSWHLEGLSMTARFTGQPKAQSVELLSRCKHPHVRCAPLVREKVGKTSQVTARFEVEGEALVLEEPLIVGWIDAFR